MIHASVGSLVMSQRAAREGIEWKRTRSFLLVVEPPPRRQVAASSMVERRINRAVAIEVDQLFRYAAADCRPRA